MGLPVRFDSPRYDRARALAAACGAPGPLRVRVALEAEPDRWLDDRRIVGPVALIGSDPHADIRLVDPPVRRRQAVLVVVAGRVVAVDLESRAGPERSGPFQPERILERDEPFRVGPYRIVAWTESAAPADGWPDPATWPPGCRFPLSSRPIVHDRLPGLVLSFPRLVSESASEWEMRSLVTFVGSASGCKLRIASRDLSEFECVLIRTPRGPWAVGLGGRGGLRERGEPSGYVPLLDGEAFEVGRWALTPRVLPAAGRDGEPAAAGLARRDPSRPPSAVSPVTELVEQFGSMQADVLEQVRQSLLTMGRWLGELHREEMDRIRAELAELRAAITARDSLAERIPQAAPSPGPPDPVEPLPAPDPVGPLPDAAVGEDLHRILVGRLEHLQREQKRRWRRLVQRATGRDA